MMDLRQQKQHLPLLIASLALRRSSLCLQRLFLYESEGEGEARVRHYDIECEAIEMLVGFFKKKYQSVLMKMFNALRTVSVLSQKREEGMSERKKRTGTTRRTNLTATPAPSDFNFGRTAVRRGEGARRGENDENALGGSGGKEESALRGIVSRIRDVNAANSLFLHARVRTEQPPHRQNASFFLPTPHPRPMSTPYSAEEEEKMLRFRNSDYRRHSRRQFILGKFSQLEGSLCELCLEQTKEQGSCEMLNSIATLRLALQGGH